MKKAQSQQGADGSQNYQASGNIVVYQGLSVSDVREIFLSMFKASFHDLGRVAQEAAIRRAEELTDEYLRKLELGKAEALENTADPDVRRTLFRAQEEYACSGDDSLRELLVDLLVERTKVSERDLKALALNEAVVAAPRLTSEQWAALAVNFVISHTRYTGPTDLDKFYHSLERNLSPFSEKLSDRFALYQHLASVGVAALGVGLPEASFGHRMQYSNPAFFTTGFAPGLLVNFGLPLELAEDARIFMPALRDSTSIQLTPNYEKNIEEVPRQSLAPGHTNFDDSLARLGKAGAMEAAAIRAEVIERIPGIGTLIDIWDRSALSSLTLSLNGIAIGHTLWSERTGYEDPLDIWL